MNKEFTCRECKYRQRWYIHPTRIIQVCSKQKSNKSSVGFKKIKITDTACNLFELD